MYIFDYIMSVDNQEQEQYFQQLINTTENIVEVEYTIKGHIYGKYIPACYHHPAEYPEAEIEEIVSVTVHTETNSILVKKEGNNLDGCIEFVSNDVLETALFEHAEAQADDYYDYYN